MDGTLTLIFANFVTTQDIITQFEMNSRQILRAWLQNLKSHDVHNLDFPPKMSKASNGPCRPIF